MKTAKISHKGKVQTVRLPQEFHLEGDEVFVKQMGNAIVLIPKKDSMNILIDSLSLFSDDFMPTRDQPL